jgi:hypothetical protein
MYTLEQIIKTWHECYGEDMTEEYAGFLDSLQATQKSYIDNKSKLFRDVSCYLKKERTS